MECETVVNIDLYESPRVEQYIDVLLARSGHVVICLENRFIHMTKAGDNQHVLVDLGDTITFSTSEIKSLTQDYAFTDYKGALQKTIPITPDCQELNTLVSSLQLFFNTLELRILLLDSTYNEIKLF